MPTSSAPVVRGRDAELVVIGAQLDRASAGAGAGVLVEGDGPKGEALSALARDVALHIASADPIGVSESVILDYLANEIDHDRGSRNGPRSRAEVWVKAAQTLLRYELPPPRSADVPAAAGRPASGPAATRPAGDMSRAP